MALFCSVLYILVFSTENIAEYTSYYICVQYYVYHLLCVHIMHQFHCHTSNVHCSITSVATSSTLLQRVLICGHMHIIIVPAFITACVTSLFDTLRVLIQMPRFPFRYIEAYSVYANSLFKGQGTHLFCESSHVLGCM